MSYNKNKYYCTICHYPLYKEWSIIFLYVCIEKILDERREKNKERTDDANK